MKAGVLLSLLLLCCSLQAKDRKKEVPFPTQFEIGRRTFFDFGPPFEYYDITLVRPTDRGTSVERISLTPAADACLRPAQIETSLGTLPESIGELLQGTNPCTIPEKDIRRERKRCKHCLVFSGAQVAMRVQCGSAVRIVRSDILDRDMFGSAPHTPEHTSWTMSLLSRLDQATGAGAMDKPVFTRDEQPSQKLFDADGPSLRQVAAGDFDALFAGAEKPSELYRAAQERPVGPTVELLNSSIKPDLFVVPAYPAIAKAAHVSGTVTFTAILDSSSAPTNLVFKSSPPLLYGAVQEAARHWSFPKEAAGQQIEVSLEFRLNCPTEQR